MTIAACYVSLEGVVLGTDSTTTFTKGTGTDEVLHFFNHGQKLFEVGDGSTLGIATWGLAHLGSISHRTLIAKFGDEIRSNKLSNFTDVTNLWNNMVWNHYDKLFATPEMQAQRKRAQELKALPMRTPDQEAELLDTTALGLGFCLGGYLLPDRLPAAYEFWYDNTMNDKCVPQQLPQGRLFCWGMPNFYYRLMFGIDEDILAKIVASKKWTGTKEELLDIIQEHTYAPSGVLPLREAIDWTHSLIYSTIKGFKFSHRHQFCGGPIEVAAISTDRTFRWVHHKDFRSATGKGSTPES